MLHDAAILLVGAVITLVVAFIYDATRLRTVAATRSQRGRERRKVQLAKRRALVEKYYIDKSSLNSFMIGRLLTAAAVLIASDALSCLLSLYISGTYNIKVFTTKPPIFDSAEEAQKYYNQHMFEAKVSAVLDSIANIVSCVSGVVAFAIVFGGYIVWRRVRHYESFNAELDTQNETLDSASDDDE